MKNYNFSLYKTHITYMHLHTTEKFYLNNSKQINLNLNFKCRFAESQLICKHSVCLYKICLYVCT